MGSAASTRICTVTSLTSDDFGQRTRQSGKFCSKISFPVSFDRRPESQKNEDKLNLVKRTLNAEAKVKECDSKVKDLERQLRTVQMRNHEITQENFWLRQQAGASMNSVPCGVVPSKVPADIETSQNAEYEEQISRLNLVIHDLQDQVDKLTSSEAVKELKIVELQKEIESYQHQVINLEELYRNRSDDDCLASVSPTFDSIVPQPQSNLNGIAASSSLTQPKKSNLRTVSAYARRPSPSKSPVGVVTRPASSDNVDRIHRNNIVVIDRPSKLSTRKGSYNSDRRRNSDDSDSDLREILGTKIRSASLHTRSPSNKSHDSGWSSSSDGRVKVYTH